MRPSKYSIVTAIWCISALFFNLHAKRQVEAHLLNSDTKLPISNATILCIESGTSTITNNEGHFKLHIIDSLFESTCKIQCLGYQNKELSISKFPDRDTVLFLDPISLQLQEIEVTATSNKREYTANSQIYKSALNHIQPYDLGDALTLLPGIEITTNDNTKARQGYLRTPVSNYESLITAMGTAIVIDGSPISNNSNLQVSNSANFGIGGHFETTSGQGNDLRQITVNNIQQIEVIRGIAPVNYGDITSGVINIKREVGVQHQTLLFQMDPNYFKFYTSRGFSLGKKHIFNADIDYKNSTSDLRIPVPNYQQFASRFAHQYLSTKQLWKNNLSIDLGYSYDVNKKDKNDLFLEKSDNEEQWMRINNRGELSFRNQQNTKVKYHFSWQEKRQYSYNSDLISSSQLISTTIKDDSEYECSLLPSRYYSAMTIDGKPMMLYSQLEILQTKQLLHQTHLFSFGSEYRYEKNNGEGRTFRNDAGYHAAYNQRDRAYSSIPSTATLTLYAQDKITIPLGDNRLTLNMGVRYDNYNPTSVTKGSDGQIIQPRINLGFDIGKNISFFAGYGISSKLAPLIFRSPDNAYIDVVSLLIYRQKTLQKIY